MSREMEGTQMKKVKITVLKTTFDAELAAEYGVQGLKPCPMMRPGQVFYADYAKPDGLSTRRGKRFTSMFSRWRTAPGKGCLLRGLDS